ncbi:hypothetical protein ACWCOV_03785 [Kribbella sp. NPDC002412]
MRTFTPPGDVASELTNGPAAHAKSLTCLAIATPSDVTPVDGTTRLPVCVSRTRKSAATL